MSLKNHARYICLKNHAKYVGLKKHVALGFEGNKNLTGLFEYGPNMARVDSWAVLSLTKNNWVRHGMTHQRTALRVFVYTDTSLWPPLAIKT